MSPDGAPGLKIYLHCLLWISLSSVSASLAWPNECVSRVLPQLIGSVSENAKLEKELQQGKIRSSYPVRSIRARLAGARLPEGAIGTSILSKELRFVNYKSGEVGIFKPYDTFNKPGAEVAAYQVSEKLELGIIPATVERTIDGKTGSVKLFIENGVHEKATRGSPGTPPYYTSVNSNELTESQKTVLDFFNYLIGNIDTGVDQYLVTKGGRVFQVDSGPAFSDWTQVLVKFSTEMPEVQRLLKIPAKEWKELLEPLIGPEKLKPFFQRIEKLRIMDRSKHPERYRSGTAN